jgi:hypothetical protein
MVSLREYNLFITIPLSIGEFSLKFSSKILGGDEKEF